MRQITDMETWLLDNEGRIFRFVVYRRMFTPQEQAAKYSDETCFEDGGTYQFGVIEEAVELGHGEWLLGIREIYDGTLCRIVSYYRMSEIRLHCFDNDQGMLDEEEGCENEL